MNTWGGREDLNIRSPYVYSLPFDSRSFVDACAPCPRSPRLLPGAIRLRLFSTNGMNRSGVWNVWRVNRELGITRAAHRNSKGTRPLSAIGTQGYRGC